MSNTTTTEMTDQAAVTCTQVRADQLRLTDQVLMASVVNGRVTVETVRNLELLNDDVEVNGTSLMSRSTRVTVVTSTL